MQGCTRRAALGASLAAVLSGCGWFGNDPDEAGVELPPLAEPLPRANVESLELNLKVGDRFPLMKTVTQELRQASVIGPALSQTRLELLLTLTVEDVQPDRKRLGVRYNRVRYSQDVAGEKFDFDSASVQPPVPRAALPYLGLVNNGFAFWIGRDNQIIEPVGFPEFLGRCVQNVPQAERAQVLGKFAQTTADEGIANFVDDSIGLLPYDIDGKAPGNVAEGDTWTRERRLMQPMPLYLQNRYTLRELTPQIAEIDILGSVTPATTSSDLSNSSTIVQASAEVDPQKKRSAETPDVIVRNGKSFGTCTIDRPTGLPLKSNVERYLDMTVRLPNGLEFEQRKRTVTTIQAFPQQRAADSGAKQDGRGPAMQ